MGANDTEFDHGVNVAAWLEPSIMDNLKAMLVALTAVGRVSFERGSDSVKLRQRGKMTATTAAEATDHATSPSSQVLLGTLVVQQVKVFAEFSDKGQKFSMIDIPEIAMEAADAVAQKVEQDILGLADGFSKQVGTTGNPLSPQVLRSAFYNLDLSDVSGSRIVILHPTQVDDVLDALQTAGAAMWGNQNVDFTILNGRSLEPGGYKGTYLGVPVFQTTNVEGINNDDDWCGLACNASRAIAFGEDDRGIRVEYDRNLKKGVTEISVDLFYDVKEREDASGVGIVSGQ
jgi:hypothetical protein